MSLSRILHRNYLESFIQDPILHTVTQPQCQTKRLTGACFYGAVQAPPLELRGLAFSLNFCDCYEFIFIKNGFDEIHLWPQKYQRLNLEGNCRELQGDLRVFSL